MKKLYLLLVAALLTTLGINAQSERNVNVPTAGTLENYISENDKYSITKLAITGNLNGKDMVLLRDMAGAKDINTPTGGKLSELDLSGAHIVASDDAYYAYGSQSFTSKDNILGSYMFVYCGRLAKLALPADLKEIETMALSSTSLREIEIPQTVTTIGDGVFVGCNDMRKIVVPNTVKTLGTGTFQRMEGLEEIVLGNGITGLEASTFMGDTRLKSISVGTGMMSLDIILFNGLTALENVHVAEGSPYLASADGVLFSSDKTELLYYPCNKPADTYAIPDGVKKVKTSAFSGTTNLTAISIPRTVTAIEGGAFGSAMALTNIAVDKENTKYTATDNILYTKDLSTLVCIPTALKLEDYTTPAEVETIEELAIAGNAFVRKICLTDNVKNIGTYAFGFCTGLEKLLLGKNISSIGEGACAGASGLTEVYCYADELGDESVNMLAFADENIMEKCILYVPKGRVDFYDSQLWVHYKEDGEDMKFFADIREMSDEAAGIGKTETHAARPVSVYSVDGRRLNARQKGLNLVRMSDGSVRKLMVR
ncbi:leucine-rich repeat domain-containing protein [Prevotella dentasini]|uniref:leucine-rich repeat domain-containing protein n=1 Tax=Prevotella dentasini TaxID=589537 RepID=UPI000469DE63|nr:leucine-rich repeat domain-containing protein [Prevotella dentasini]